MGLGCRNELENLLALFSRCKSYFYPFRVVAYFQNILHVTVTCLYLQGILQSQGRLMRKMRFIPSSLTSNSHRLLTALVDSRHKKVYKVKNCITDIDPEREKEEKEKVNGLNGVYDCFFLKTN